MGLFNRGLKSNVSTNGQPPPANGHLPEDGAMPPDDPEARPEQAVPEPPAREPAPPAPAPEQAVPEQAVPERASPPDSPSRQQQAAGRRARRRV